MRIIELDGFKFYDKKGYYFREKPTRISIHRYIWEKINGVVPDGYVLHHIDHNKENNDINNLICLTKAEHIYLHQSSELTKKRKSKTKHTEGIRISNTSGYKGVHFHKKAGKYTALIRIENKRKYLGLFLTAEEAAVAYNKASFELWGSEAYQNKIVN